MLTQILSGIIPLADPKHVMLSPIAILVRGPVLEGFSPKVDVRLPTDAALACVEERAPAIDVNPAPAAPSQRAIRRRTAPSRKTQGPDAPSRGTQAAIPTYALEFHEDSAFVATTSKLALFLHEDDARPLPVRVVERSACTVRWYSVESWHANVRRWVDRGSSAKAEEAFDIAHNMPWLSTADDE